MPLFNYAPAASIRQDYAKTIADIAALRAVTITQRFDGQLVFINVKDAFYELEPTSGGVDDGNLIIKPTDEVGAARWEKRTKFAQAAPLPHKNTHKFGGSDTFVAADLVDAVVRRLRESGSPTDLLLGTITDGEFLKRSGTSIISAVVGGIPEVLAWKDVAELATTANITLSGVQPIDGVGTAAGFRIVVKDQTIEKDNGIYLVAAGVWTRTTDADTDIKMNHAVVPVAGGDVNADRIFRAIATDRVGTDPIVWEGIDFNRRIIKAGSATSGTSDDLVKIVAAASAGDVLILAAGDHDIAGITITIDKAKITLILDRGAKIKSSVGIAQLINVSAGGSDFTLIGGEMEIATNVTCAIKVTASVDRGHIERVHFTKLGIGSPGPAIQINPGVATLDDWTIENCHYVLDNMAHGIEFSTAALTLNRWKIQGNRFVSSSPVAGSQAIRGAAASPGFIDSKIQNNIIDKADDDGIFIANSLRSHFDENHVRNCGGDGIQLAVTTESKAHGNHCSGNIGFGINETGVSDFNLFDANHLRGNTGGAINVVGAGSVNQGTLS